MTCIIDFASKIFNQWEGKITKDEKSIRIKSNNLLGNKKVECECVVGFLKNKKYPYYVDACEKTYCILGGQGCPCENEEDVEKSILSSLEKFKFKRKEQLSLFDF